MPLAYGTRIDQVTLEIDYEIIEHFSSHLYSNPYKAVEELVVNGFDAFCSEVFVFIPGEQVVEKVLIWDDGVSMNVDGLKSLWKIARSPKRENRLIDREGKSRKVIGKFGIGKLASYSLGKEITHLCKINDQFFLTSINFDDLKDKTNIDINTKSDVIVTAGASTIISEPEAKRIRTYQSPIIELTNDQVDKLMAESFIDVEKIPKNLFSKKSWTIAIINNLKDVELKLGRLKWILGNAMPIRPDFKIYVNLEEIIPTLLKKGIYESWDFKDAKVIDALNNKWQDAVNEAGVVGSIKFSEEKGLDPNSPNSVIPYVMLPNLGKVWGVIRLYEETLHEGRSSEYARSYGFFIYVLSRLINEGDAKVTLNDPSFRTFYRSQYIIYADGLDSDLLADRERFAASQKKSELEVIQKAVYSVTTSKQREIDRKEEEQSDFAHRLPTFSREAFMEPLSALWTKKGPNSELGFDLAEPKVEVKAKGKNEGIARLDEDGSKFIVNEDHPYIKTVTSKLGGGKVAKEAIAEFEYLFIMETLFEGYLYEIGIPDEKVLAIMEWRDRTFRLLATTDRQSPYQAIQNLEAASYRGNTQFEQALVEVLQMMGFKAEKDGASGKKDVILSAYAGDNSYTLTFEAKGKSSGALPNDDAEVGGAQSHCREAKAEHAVIVAREFAGFKQLKDGEKPAILKECEASGIVSIMTVEAIGKLLYAMTKYFYSLDLVKSVFTTIESPEEKLQRIEKLENPIQDLDYRELLERIYEEQEGLSDGRPVSYFTIFQKYYKDEFKFEEEFVPKLSALHTLAFPNIQFNKEKDRIALKQSPENIARAISVKIQNISK